MAVSPFKNAMAYMFDADELDASGCDNVLVGSDISASFVSGYNNLNVKVEKYDGPALVPDCEKLQRIVNL